MSNLVDELKAIAEAVPALHYVPESEGTYECPICGGEGTVDADEWSDGGRDSGWLAGVQAFGSGKELEATKAFIETFTPSKILELLAHIERLDKVISDCATAVGAAVGPTCSIEFKEQLPDEIRLKVERLKADNERLKAERNEMALDQVTRAMIKATQQADKGE